MYKRITMMGILLCGFIAGLFMLGFDGRGTVIGSAGSSPTPYFFINVGTITNTVSPEFTVTDTDITFHGGATNNVFELYGNTTTRRIIVEAGVTDAVFVFNGLNMRTHATPFLIHTGADVEIFLVYQTRNYLHATGAGNGINMMPNSYLLIDGTGTLSMQGIGGTGDAGLRVGSIAGNAASHAVLTIRGGIILAQGGANDAGIGGNIQENGGTINIEGGNITAISSSHGAAIGGGHSANPVGPNIRISGGVVYARGASISGIGSGGLGTNTNGGGTVLIEGGEVTAHGILYGIGGANATVTINSAATVQAFSNGVRAIGTATDTVLSDDNNYIAAFTFAAGITTAMSVEVMANYVADRTINMTVGRRSGAISMPTDANVELYAFTTTGTPMGVIRNVVVGNPITTTTSGQVLVFHDVQLVNFHTITFDSGTNAHFGEPEKLTSIVFHVLPGEIFSTNNTLPQLTNLSKGRTFYGWVLQGTTNAFAPNAAVSSNQIVVPVWTAIQSRIYFDIGFAGGPNVESIPVWYDYRVDRQGALPTPQRPGYNFDGWYLGSTRFTNATIFTGVTDVTLVASWSLRTFQVTFVAGVEFVVIPGKDVTFTHLFGELAKPERRGHTFAGWFTDLNDATTRVTADTIFTFTSDVTLYAKWLPETAQQHGGEGNASPWMISTMVLGVATLSLLSLLMIIILRAKRNNDG